MLKNIIKKPMTIHKYALYILIFFTAPLINSMHEASQDVYNYERSVELTFRRLNLYKNPTTASASNKAAHSIWQEHVNIAQGEVAATGCLAAGGLAVLYLTVSAIREAQKAKVTLADISDFIKKNIFTIAGLLYCSIGLYPARTDLTILSKRYILPHISNHCLYGAANKLLSVGTYTLIALCIAYELYNFKTYCMKLCKEKEQLNEQE